MTNIYDYITEQEASFKTVRVPVTGNKTWNMAEHIDRCTNVANGWFHKGKDDGLRPYKNIVKPIINVARRSEGFDVKDIEPFVNDEQNYHKSFLVRKYHPKWARKHNIDTFIDDVVESQIVYGLTLVKSVKGVRPEVVPLQQIAFCDQTDILSGAIALKHEYTPSQMQTYKGKWNDEMVEMAITMAKSEKPSHVEGQSAATPSKYIEVYEIHGSFPEHWLDDGEYYGDPNKYCDQIHLVTFYTDNAGKKNGITLFKAKETEPVFKALKIDTIYGRACGVSEVEDLFEPQVWTNYSAIKIKALLDGAALLLLQTSDKKFAKDNKISDLEPNTILTHEQGGELSQVNIQPQNLQAFINHQTMLENDARIMGSASDAQLGTNPVSGTPFALQSLVVQQGQGIHEWRQGKIATFISEIYRDWILKYLVREMNAGQKFLDELSVDELSELAERVAIKRSNEWVRDKILSTGQVPTEQERQIRMDAEKQGFIKKGGKQFIEIMKDELKNLPMDVYVNIKGKQKDMNKAADSITNLIRELFRNPDAFRSSGIGKLLNELLENSGFSPINFAEFTKPMQLPEPMMDSPMMDKSGGMPPKMMNQMQSLTN